MATAMTSVAKMVVLTGCLLALSCGQALGAQSSDLFVQQISGGNLHKAGKHGFRLELAPAPAQTVAFTDRPARQGSALATSKFVSDWAKYGFKQVPPNAALSIGGAPSRRDVMLLTLSHPRLMKGHLVYRAAALKGAPSFGLQRFTHRADRVRAMRFGDASLFIDSTGTFTPVNFFISLDGSGSQTTSQLTLDTGIDLAWSSEGPRASGPGLQISGLAGVPVPVVSFSLNGQAMAIQTPGGASGVFTVQLYLEGSAPVMSGVATIGPGVSVQMTVNNMSPSVISSGAFNAPLQ